MLIRILLLLAIGLGLSPGGYTVSKNTVSAAESRSATPTNPEDFSVAFFPVAPYHIGDHLSVRVTYSGQEDIGGQEITIALADQPNQALESTKFSQFSQQAVFYWILDTEGHQPGYLNFLFTIPEMNLTWQKGINLLPDPGGQPETWAKVHTNCCAIHYLTGTDAEEDINQIQQILEARTSEALAQFKSKIGPNTPHLEEPLSLVLIPTVIGQGGFATDIAVMTYSDRNWAGTDFSNIAHHEIVHVLDRQLNDGPRPSLFAEGLAVYFAGGHYRDGDPLHRAAALLKIGRYIPIMDFVDDFYAAQHEISYIEAAGLVAYLAEIWGIEQFLDFYFNLPEADRDSESISSALEDQFDMTLADLENDYIDTLQTLNPSPQVQADVRLTITTYEMMRRYQQIRIPSAYFRDAWWPPIDSALERGIPDDYAPREKAPVDVIIENLFLEGYSSLDTGDVQRIEENLNKIERLLDLAEENMTAFSHYTIGWPLPHPHRIAPGF